MGLQSMHIYFSLENNGFGQSKYSHLNLILSPAKHHNTKSSTWDQALLNSNTWWTVSPNDAFAELLSRNYISLYVYG